ncbi:hypothetical protein I6F30_25460 [Bradyrhizobium sp. NBAIM20]|uniref:hypothetical protein n=1 Tax=unclassified Bradyrhizobium TaxID=2631580 RepID=UPI001CD1CFBC|nr:MULTISPECIES: hypothetical protein [unclassified Bradyrhizobium]MCA1414474.1 hypothetical protein [Bradyrhizobium sp. NBAIM20]MCA1459864.1 hypothetical protein [Bradyrhizobium sp. NBAIM18]
MSSWGSPGATLGEMIVSHATAAPPPAPAAPPPPEIPATSAEAAARLSALKADPGWREEYLGGNPRHAKEMRDLQAKIDSGGAPEVDMAMAGLLDDAPFQSTGRLQMIGATEMFRDLGIRDEVIRETLTNREVTPQEHEAVARLKAERMRDQAWVKELLAGNGQHRRDLMLMDIVLTSPVKAA